MANVEQNALDISVIKTQVAQLLSNSVQPKDGVSTTQYTDDTLIPIQNVGESVKFIKRSDFLTAVLGSIRRFGDTVNEVTEVDQLVLGKKSGYFNDNYFFGRVLAFPITSESDIEDIFIFSIF